MVNKVIKEAEKWVGYIEKASNYKLESMTANAGSQNFTYFAEWYKNMGYGNYQGQPWCAVFVSYVFGNSIGNSEKVMHHFHYCPTGVGWFRSNQRFFTKNPIAGDVIFFKDSAGLAVHTGIVTGVDSANVYTIEGNTSSEKGVVANGGCVKRKSYSLSYSGILGYGRPLYNLATNLYSYDNTVDNLVADRIITVENMAYWEKVLDGRQVPDKEYLRTLLDRYHVKCIGQSAECRG